MAIVAMEQDSLVYLRAEGISAPHAFTTRQGGVSKDHLASLNIGFSRGDSRENVLSNYTILGEVLGFTPDQVAATRQTHSDIVRTVTAKDMGRGITRSPFPECDALVTADEGVVLVVFSADCTPILLHDPVTGIVGAAMPGGGGRPPTLQGKPLRPWPLWVPTRLIFMPPLARTSANAASRPNPTCRRLW